MYGPYNGMNANDLSKLEGHFGCYDWQNASHVQSFL